jgi:flagellar hook assembly protein FlgD
VAAAGALSQNAPNPFNPSTQIRYTMAIAGKAKLQIYDSQGRLVRTLIETHKEEGEHAVVWDGRNDSGEPVVSGTYYYELSTNGGREARKAVLVR